VRSLHQKWKAKRAKSVKAKATKEWLNQFKAGTKVIKRKGKKKSTLKTYTYGIKYLCEWMGKTPDEIVKEYQQDVKANMYSAFEKWEEIFKDFSDWLQEQFTGTTPSTYFAAAKELVNVNVPRSARLQVQGPEATPRIIKPIGKEDLIELDKACDERERTFIRFLKDSGISRADAVLLNYGDVKRGLERGDRYIKLDVYRGKENVEYETWIGPDTIEMLKIWFNIRQRRGEQVAEESPIFADYKGERLTAEALSIMFHRITKRIGITISPHRLRKFFETYAAVEVRHPIVLKYWMGHKVRRSRDVEGRYIIPPEPEQRKMYMRAYGNLSLTEVASEKERRIKAIVDTAILAGISEEKIKQIKMIIRTKPGITPEQVIRILKEETKTQPNGGSDCPTFKEVAENELLTYLQQGWQIVHNLQNGRVIVSKR
jgi:integrase